MSYLVGINDGLLSDEHLVQTENGWVKAKELNIGDKIINFEGKIVEITKMDTKIDNNE